MQIATDGLLLETQVFDNNPVLSWETVVTSDGEAFEYVIAYVP